MLILLWYLLILSFCSHLKPCIINLLATCTSQIASPTINLLYVTINNYGSINYYPSGTLGFAIGYNAVFNNLGLMNVTGNKVYMTQYTASGYYGEFNNYGTININSNR